MAIILVNNLVLQPAPPTEAGANNARICYQTYTRGNVPTVSTTATGYFASALSNALTYEFWQPTASPATVEYDLGSNKSLDYFAIGAHTLGTTATAVDIEVSTNGATYSNVSGYTPETDQASLVLLAEPITARYVRFKFTYADDAPKMAVIYCGLSLKMERGMYGGHSPVTLSRDTELYPQEAVSGQWIGRSIVSHGFQSSASWQHLTAQWYRDYFDPFVSSARRYPFFFAWRPAGFPNEVALCWTTGNIRPSNMGIRDFMEVSINFRGYGVDLP